MGKQDQNISAAVAEAAATKEKEATYLVIGAGTAGLSFIDSLLTLDANATVILVDRHSQPGGHWTKSYPFVRLHQASCNYGVNSLPLSNIRDKKGNERFSVVRLNKQKLLNTAFSSLRIFTAVWIQAP